MHTPDEDEVEKQHHRKPNNMNLIKKNKTIREM